MNDWLLAVLVLVGMWFVWDVWQLVRKQSAALDRDQDIMDAVGAHESDYLSFEEAEIIAVHVADMSREDALVAFIDAYDKRYHSDRSD